MKKTGFDFKKYQNLSKSRKMMIRFLVYSIVVFIITLLIYNTEETIKQETNEDQVEQIDIKIDDVQTE